MKNSRPASVVVHSPRPAGFTYPCNSSIAGQNSHARAFDADTTGALKDIHRRVATAILFESSGGQTDKSAHLPELRFALGEPGAETTSIDLAASQMEARGFFIRKKGTDGFQFGFKPTLNRSSTTAAPRWTKKRFWRRPSGSWKKSRTQTKRRGRLTNGIASSSRSSGEPPRT